MTSNIFWTGGFDSTFRLLELIDDESISEVNIFYIALNIDNEDHSTTKRRSIDIEIKTMSKILSVINKSKIKKFTIFSDKVNLQHYVLFFEGYQFMEYVERDFIEYTTQLKMDYLHLYKNDIVPRPVSQWGSITQILDELNIKAEICLEKGGGIQTKLSTLSDLVDKSVVNRVFGRYIMSLFDVTREDMALKSEERGWNDVMKETWSCWYPIDSKPCGVCFTCIRRPEMGEYNLLVKNTGFLLDDIYNKEVYFEEFSDQEFDFFIDKVEHEDEDLLMNFLSGKKIELQEESINTNGMKVTANIATQPSRFQTLLKTLNSIDGQFDEIRIYLNEYEYVPDELKKYTTVIGDNLTDNGKFFWSENPNEYYFTLDDDIIYPSDYVSKTLPKIKDRIVTYHGHKLLGIGRSYYRGHRVYTFRKSFLEDKEIEVPGTGVMAFNSNLFKPTLWKSPNFMMTDILVGLEASLYNKKVVCLKREENWIRPTEPREPEGIFTKYKYRDEIQTKMSDMIQIHRGLENLSPLNDGLKACHPGIKDVYIILNEIEKRRDTQSNFYHIGSGSGKFISHVSLVSDFERYIGVETKKERIHKSNQLISEFKIDKVEFIDNLNIDTNSIVFLNDMSMSTEQTKLVWSKIPNGSHLLCHNMLDGIFPESKIEIGVNWSDVVKKNYYYYKK